MSLEAIDIYDPLTYPTRRDEDWKYSDLGRSLRATPEPGEASVERTEGVLTGPVSGRRCQRRHEVRH